MQPLRDLARQIDWALLLGGAAVFAIVHAVAVRVTPVAAPSRAALDGWWLNAVETVVAVAVAMVVVSWLVLRRRPGRLAARAVSWAVGAMAGMALTLAYVGPGNIWPIVLAVGGAVLGVSVAAAAALAHATSHPNHESGRPTPPATPPTGS